MSDPTFQASTMDIIAGYAVVQDIDGPPGPADDITYVCTLFMPDGVYSDIAGMIPNVARYPSPVGVTPHLRGTVFPAYRVNGHVQLSMPRELPQFGPCPGAGPLRAQGGSSLLAAWNAAPESERRAFVQAIKEYA